MLFLVLTILVLDVLFCFVGGFVFSGGGGCLFGSVLVFLMCGFVLGFFLEEGCLF